MARAQPSSISATATGVDGLDQLLRGGLPRGDMHLIQGTAGTGKTTIALHYLMEGRRAGEKTLFVTLSQSKEQLERIARSHGWNLEGIHVHEISPGTLSSRIAQRQTILPTAEVELLELFHDLGETVEQLRPLRAVFDSLTMLELLSGTVARYHQEVVLLRQLFVERGCTLLSIADHPAENPNGQRLETMLHPLSGCVINLEQEPRPYGDVRRRLRIVKTRGVPHNGGYHDLKIFTGKLEVYPRLGAYKQEESRTYSKMSCGIDSIDALLGGGLNSGTSCLIVGASAVGKSSIATLFSREQAHAGRRSVIYLFDERPQTYIERSEQVGIGIRREVEAGRLSIEQLDPGEIAPGQFAQMVREEVEERGAKVIVIDSVVGYFAAMGTADVLITQLHELMTYVTRKDVLLILCGVQEGFMSIGVQQAVDVSYLSDTIIALNYFEQAGDLCRAIAVVKKKYGAHRTTIHRFSIIDGRLQVSREPLTDAVNVMVQSGAKSATSP